MKSRWFSILKSLHTALVGGKAAPHKPLLLLILLARARKGLPNRLPFREADPELQKLLREFGTGSRLAQPELPFWHLRSSGIWKLEDEDTIPLGKNEKRPTRTLLLQRNCAGHVEPSLWKELLDKPGLIQCLAGELLAGYWPESYHDEILAQVGLGRATLPETERTRDPEFRYKVIEAYEGRCAICGFDGLIESALFGLEAAHIHWHAYSGPDDVTNGLALCSLHHKAFDYGVMSMNDQLRILVSERLRGQASPVREGIIGFSGKDLRRAQRTEYEPAPEHLDWHRTNVFKGPERKMSS